MVYATCRMNAPGTDALLKLAVAYPLFAGSIFFGLVLTTILVSWWLFYLMDSRAKPGTEVKLLWGLFSYTKYDPPEEPEIYVSRTDDQRLEEADSLSRNEQWILYVIGGTDHPQIDINILIAESGKPENGFSALDVMTAVAELASKGHLIYENPNVFLKQSGAHIARLYQPMPWELVVDPTTR